LVLLKNSSVCFTLSPTAIAPRDRHNVIDNFGTLPAALDRRDGVFPDLQKQAPIHKSTGHDLRTPATRHQLLKSCLLPICRFDDSRTEFETTGTQIGETTRTRLIAVEREPRDFAVPP
jgi:hypothetical protein